MLRRECSISRGPAAGPMAFRLACALPAGSPVQAPVAAPNAEYAGLRDRRSEDIPPSDGLKLGVGRHQPFASFLSEIHLYPGTGAAAFAIDDHALAELRVCDLLAESVFP